MSSNNMADPRRPNRVLRSAMIGPWVLLRQRPGKGTRAVPHETVKDCSDTKGGAEVHGVTLKVAGKAR